MQVSLVRNFARVVNIATKVSLPTWSYRLSASGTQYWKTSRLFSEAKRTFSTQSKSKEESKQGVNEKVRSKSEDIDLDSEEAKFAFETNLQTISLALMKTEDSTQCFDLYEQLIEKHPKLNGEELSLILYYAAYYKGDLTSDPRLMPLLHKILDQVDGMSPIYMYSLAYCLGILASDYGVQLSGEDQKNVIEKLIASVEEYQPSQISSIGFAGSQFMTTNIEKLHELVTKLSSIAINNAESLKGLDYANFFATYIGNQEVIANLFKVLCNRINELDNSDPSLVSRLISCVAELNLDASEFYSDLFINIIKPNADNYEIDDLCNILLLYSEKMGQAPYVFKDILKEICRRHNEVTLIGYVNIWLALAKFKANPETYERQLNLITEIPFATTAWSKQEFEDFELVNIIIAMATIRYDNQPFLQMWVNVLSHRLGALDNDDLINLARAFSIYTRQFQDFYHKIHEECVQRLDGLDVQDKELLTETFSKARDFLPQDSPFLKH